MSAARLGGPIALIVLGLIAALAVANRLPGVNLSMIGWILAGAGAIWLVLELVLNGRRSAMTRETTAVRGADPRADQVVEREVRRES